MHLCVCDSTQGCAVPRGPVTTVRASRALSSSPLSDAIFALFLCKTLLMRWRQRQSTEMGWGEHPQRTHTLSCTCKRIRTHTDRCTVCIYNITIQRKTISHCKACCEVVTKHWKEVVLNQSCDSQGCYRDYICLRDNAWGRSLQLPFLKRCLMLLFLISLYRSSAL